MVIQEKTLGTIMFKSILIEMVGIKLKKGYGNALIEVVNNQ